MSDTSGPPTIEDPENRQMPVCYCGSELRLVQITQDGNRIGHCDTCGWQGFVLEVEEDPLTEK
jgi:hypothetical protein